MGNGDAMDIDIDSDEEAVASRLEELQQETEELDAEPEDSTRSHYFEPVEENGRTYANETYFLPNDDNEETRNSIVHQVYTSALSGQLTLHRMREDVSRILDVGANPCDWAIAIAERHPNAEIVATDLSPYLAGNLPPNLLFQVDDAREEWTYSEPFDYIHMRSMTGAFPDWKFIYGQVYKHLADDGFFEIVDRGFVHHNTPVENSYLEIYNAACQSAAENAGVSLGLEHMQKERIEEVGLKIFRSVTFEIPIGQWHEDPHQKALGKMALVGSLERLEAQSVRLLTKYLGWSVQGVKDLCAKVQEELRHPNAKPSFSCSWIVARKLPLPP